MQFSILDMLWIILIFSTLVPIFQHRYLEMQRYRIIKKLEDKRKSRVIILIHRQETFSFLGIPFSRFIDIEDSESILRAIRFTPKNLPIDIIIHTPGGLVLASEQIAKALVKHKAPVTIFIPHYAMSGGTLIALSGDKIVMDENAVLGPLDPQLGEYPAASIIAAIKQKPINKVDDKTLILGDVSKKAISQINKIIISLLELNGVNEEKAKHIADILGGGAWTHDYPIEYDEAKNIGLPVEIGLPEEIYELMDYYPQSTNRRPSVSYIPVPYPRMPDREKK